MVFDRLSTNGFFLKLVRRRRAAPGTVLSDRLDPALRRGAETGGARVAKIPEPVTQIALSYTWLDRLLSAMILRHRQDWLFDNPGTITGFAAARSF